MKTVDVIIIGSGPAGIAAAIQLKRYAINTLILDKEAKGGLLRNANLVENYPGFPHGISGGALTELFIKHLDKFDINVAKEKVIALDYTGQRFQIRTDLNVYESRIVVIASGTRPVPLQKPEISSLSGSRVFYEVTDLLESFNMRIDIIGAGDAAFDYALNLARNNRAVIHNRNSDVSCLPLLRDRASNTATIEYRENEQLVGVERNLDRISAEWMQNGVKFKCETDYLLIAIGRKPELGFISASMSDEIKNLEDEGILYMIGDVRNGALRQAGISVGDGIRAAMKINLKLRQM